MNLTLDLESNFEKLRKTRIFGFFSILQFLVSALEIPSRFRFRSGSLDFSSFGTSTTSAWPFVWETIASGTPAAS